MGKKHGVPFTRTTHCFIRYNENSNTAVDYKGGSVCVCVCVRGMSDRDSVANNSHPVMDMVQQFYNFLQHRAKNGCKVFTN